jgi:hypothetical protein
MNAMARANATDADAELGGLPGEDPNSAMPPTMQNRPTTMQNQNPQLARTRPDGCAAGCPGADRTALRRCHHNLWGPPIKADYHLTCCAAAPAEREASAGWDCHLEPRSVNPRITVVRKFVGRRP